MENKPTTVTVRCDAYSGLTIYSSGRRISERALSVWSAIDTLADLGFVVERDELPLSEGLRVTFTR